ncbi:hypothetical protein BDZ94DRAFT_189740 [Collybia nuda]|uniref:Uncharacterized protein n=1 Tax=Collybia nuda TaxID=64659 RepID=A0A9P5XW39_9AGAR|nr:hypothetical protein BDZ94DRAFT_189740 [Collybia nuda]
MQTIELYGAEPVKVFKWLTKASIFLMSTVTGMVMISLSRILTSEVQLLSLKFLFFYLHAFVVKHTPKSECQAHEPTRIKTTITFTMS